MRYKRLKLDTYKLILKIYNLSTYNKRRENYN